MLHLKVRLRFHFKKHKKFLKNVTKKMHLSLQLMVHLTKQPRVHLLISNLTLDEFFISSQSEKCPNTELFLVRIYPHSDWIRTRKNSVFGLFLRSAYIEQNKRNCYSIDKVRMQVRRRVGGLVKSAIYCFSGASFSSKCMQGRFRIKKYELFQRKRFMDCTFPKNSTTNISTVS